MRLTVLGLLTLLACLIGCGSATQTDALYHRSLPNLIDITGTAFIQDGALPVESTCGGGGQSPALFYANTVPGALSYAVTMTGALPADAPTGSDSTNLLVYNIPPSVSRLPSQLTPVAVGQLGAVMGKNGRGQTGYWAPCPPPGRQPYLFRVYALNAFLPADSPLNRAGLLEAMRGHVLAYGELRGYVYASPKKP